MTSSLQQKKQKAGGIYPSDGFWKLYIITQLQWKQVSFKTFSW